MHKPLDRGAAQLIASNGQGRVASKAMKVSIATAVSYLTDITVTQFDIVVYILIV